MRLPSVLCRFALCVESGPEVVQVSGQRPQANAIRQSDHAQLRPPYQLVEHPLGTLTIGG
jgi:hypothetical protein